MLNLCQCYVDRKKKTGGHNKKWMDRQTDDLALVLLYVVPNIYYWVIKWSAKDFHMKENQNKSLQYLYPKCIVLAVIWNSKFIRNSRFLHAPSGSNTAFSKIDFTVKQIRIKAKFKGMIWFFLSFKCSDSLIFVICTTFLSLSFVK